MSVKSRLLKPAPVKTAIRCAYCHEDLDTISASDDVNVVEQSLKRCRLCGTVIHTICSDELTQCTTFGCNGTWESPEVVSLDIIDHKLNHDYVGSELTLSIGQSLDNLDKQEIEQKIKEFYAEIENEIVISGYVPGPGEDWTLSLKPTIQFNDGADQTVIRISLNHRSILTFLSCLPLALLLLPHTVAILATLLVFVLGVSTKDPMLPMVFPMIWVLAIFTIRRAITTRHIHTSTKRLVKQLNTPRIVLR